MRFAFTGERVVTSAGGFNPTWQRHVATYRLCAELLPHGRVLDAGCGVGHSFELLAPRETVGVDVDARSLAGQARETHQADMRALPFADRSFDAVLSVQSIEHVPEPGAVLREFARVLRSGGVAVIVTPNRLTFARPDEVIDPYHYFELDPHQLRQLCQGYFDEVEILGLCGSETFQEFVRREHERLDALLARDRLRVRRLIPRRLRQPLYDLMLSRSRRRPDPVASSISADDFSLSADQVQRAYDLVAVCRGPLVSAGGA
ncbi:MAG: class I SAM-dependent methyltransferase [Solirubrobacteraceae bacterium]